MSISEHPVTPPGSSNGEDEIARHLEALAARYGNKFLREGPPTTSFSEHGMRAPSTRCG